MFYKKVNFRIINEISDFINQHSHYKNVVFESIKFFSNKIGLEDCVLYLYDNKEKVLYQKYAINQKLAANNEIINPLQISLSEGITGFSGRTKYIALVNDVTKDKRYIKDDQFRGSELAIPILYKGELIGVIDSEHRDIGFFNDNHVFILNTLVLNILPFLLTSNQKKLTSENYHHYYLEFIKSLKTDAKFLDPEITLEKAANDIRLSAPYLSTIINRYSGKNFNDVINSMRIEFFISQIQQGKHKSFSLLGLAYSSGFNSKSTFNRSFKKHIGTTPYNFIKSKNSIKF